VKFDDEVAKQLDAVVGDSYDPPRRWKATITKWLVAAVLGVGMSALIVGILHTHVMKAQTAPAPPAPSKPVPVYTVPPK
jgi:hypothetical protein